MLFAHFVRCKGQIMLVFVRYKGQKVCIFVRYRGQNCPKKLIYASFFSKKSFSATLFSFFSIQTAAKRHLTSHLTENLPQIGGSLCIAAEIISRFPFRAYGV